jgi:hypothetical protein
LTPQYQFYRGEHIVRRFPVAIVLGLSAALCASARAGDVEVIHNSEPGLWADDAGRTLELVEDLAIGVDDGDPDLVFGRISKAITDSGGRILVLDVGFNRIKRFTFDGEFVDSFGREGQGPGEFVRPSAIAVDAENNVYVAGLGPRVTIFAPDGTPLDDFNVESKRAYTSSAFVDADGDVFLCYFDEQRNSVVHEYGPDHKHLRSFCQSYAGDRDVPADEERFQAGGDFDVGSDDILYYTQRWPYEIRCFTLDGTLTRRIQRENDFLTPAEIERHNDGATYRLGVSNYRIVILGDGRILNFALIFNKDDPSNPETVADFFDADGHLLTTTRFHGLVIGDDSADHIFVADNSVFPMVKRYRVVAGE